MNKHRNMVPVVGVQTPSVVSDLVSAMENFAALLQAHGVSKAVLAGNTPLLQLRSAVRAGGYRERMGVFEDLAAMNTQLLPVVSGVPVFQDMSAGFQKSGQSFSMTQVLFFMKAKRLRPATFIETLLLAALDMANPEILGWPLDEAMANPVLCISPEVLQRRPGGDHLTLQLIKDPDGRSVDLVRVNRSEVMPSWYRYAAVPMD